MRQTKRTLAIMAFALASCSTTVVPATTPTTNTIILRFYATTPMIPLLHDLTAQYSQIYPDYAFETTTGNYEAMLDKLMTGETAYVLTNHLPNDVPDNPVLAWPIGQDGIAVIVHPQNNLTNITTAQLRGIYLGHVSNWNEVGGDEANITVISREDGSGTRAEFEDLLIGARQTTQSAQIAPSSSAMIESVSQIPEAIGYISMSYIDNRVRALSIDNVAPTLKNVSDNVYPLRATMYVMGLVQPEGDYLKFISWIQAQAGQAVVAKRYAPLTLP